MLAMESKWGFIGWNAGAVAIVMVSLVASVFLFSGHTNVHTVWPATSASADAASAALEAQAAQAAIPPSSAKAKSARPAPSRPAISLPSRTQLGVYTGPGAIGAHMNFQSWLGRSVPYGVDYVDYKGGWQKDFVDSQAWLAGPWGEWVAAASGRRLELAVPLLENSNAGQFSQGVNGDFDSYFTQLAQELVQNHLGDSIIRLGYEANCNTIGPWQATDNPSGYKALYRHDVNVMRSVVGNAFVFDWSLCNGLQNGHALNSFDSFYPGNDVVDIISMDIYDVKWQDTTATPESRWSYAYNRTMGIGEMLAFARGHGKPPSYPEWGLYKPGDNFAGGGDDPYFIQQMSNLVASTNPIYQSYFDLDWGGGVLSDFPQGQSLYRQLFGG